MKIPFTHHPLCLPIEENCGISLAENGFYTLKSRIFQQASLSFHCKRDVNVAHGLQWNALLPPQTSCLFGKKALLLQQKREIFIDKYYFL